jgi:hypothetical protein
MAALLFRGAPKRRVAVDLEALLEATFKRFLSF